MQFYNYTEGIIKREQFRYVLKYTAFVGFINYMPQASNMTNIVLIKKNSIIFAVHSVLLLLTLFELSLYFYSFDRSIGQGMVDTHQRSCHYHSLLLQHMVPNRSAYALLITKKFGGDFEACLRLQYRKV